MRTLLKSVQEAPGRKRETLLCRIVWKRFWTAFWKGTTSLSAPDVARQTCLEALWGSQHRRWELGTRGMWSATSDAFGCNSWLSLAGKASLQQVPPFAAIYTASKHITRERWTLLCYKAKSDFFDSPFSSFLNQHRRLGRRKTTGLGIAH